MKTFRGLVNGAKSYPFLEKIGNSIWWTNGRITLKDDPELFRYFEKRDFDKEYLFLNLEYCEPRRIFFEADSRGYSGLKIGDSVHTSKISNLLNFYSSSKKNIFLSEIPFDESEFPADSRSDGAKFVIEKDINDYISKQLFPTRLYHGEGILKYFKGNDLVCLFAPTIRFPIYD